MISVVMPKHMRRIFFDHCYRILAYFFIAVSAMIAQWIYAEAPYLTGVIEDEESQTLEIPRLPSSWQQTIAWMAPEGQKVDVGDLVVQLDQGELGSDEEIKLIELEQRKSQAETQIATTELAIIDSETAVVKAEANLRLAEVDATIPAAALTQLDYDQYKLNRVNALNSLDRARETLENRLKQLVEQRRVSEVSIATAESEWKVMRDAIVLTELRANKPGLVLHAENPRTGTKIYAGETLYPTVVVAMVSNQENLHFVFWVHETDIRKLSIGSKLLVTADAIAGESVDATVNWVSNQAETRDNWSKGGYFKVIAKPDQTLSESYLPGMSLFAERTP